MVYVFIFIHFILLTFDFNFEFCLLVCLWHEIAERMD